MSKSEPNDIRERLVEFAIRVLFDRTGRVANHARDLNLSDAGGRPVDEVQAFRRKPLEVRMAHRLHALIGEVGDEGDVRLVNDIVAALDSGRWKDVQP